MKIAVQAANGRTGQAFVELALQNGHEVTAGVNTHNSLKPHERLHVIHCDATDAVDVEALLTGQDAVVSFIGHVKGSQPHVQADAMHTVLGTMRKLGMSRLVSLTGTGVRFPGDKIPLIDRLMNVAVSLIDPARVKDGRDHMRVLEQSSADWTVIRVLKLYNGTQKPFKLTEHGPTKWFVSRQETAAAVLQVLEEGSFIRQTPIISRT